MNDHSPDWFWLVVSIILIFGGVCCLLIRHYFAEKAAYLKRVIDITKTGED